MPQDKDKRRYRSRSPGRRSSKKKSKGSANQPVTTQPRSTSLTTSLMTPVPAATSITDQPLSTPPSTVGSEPTLTITTLTIQSVDPRVDWRRPDQMEAASTMDEKIQAMVERALSKALATPKQAQSRQDAAMAGTHDIQRQDPAVGDSCNLQRQGPAVGTPCTQLHQDPAVGDPCMTRTQGPAVGSPCSPPSSIVRPMDSNHVSPLASLPYAQSSIEQWNDSYADDDSTTEENNPFAAMPGLEDCPLAGLRSALSRPVEHLTTSERQKALWRQARGGTEVRQVKTFRSEPCTQTVKKTRHSCHQNYLRICPFLNLSGRLMSP